MASLYHPFDTEALYRLDEDDNVRVTRGNAVGTFTTEGVHLSGEIRQADPQLCMWVGNNPNPLSAYQRIGRSTKIENA
jgi:hypothetical protein